MSQAADEPDIEGLAPCLGKVTAFIVRPSPTGSELLVFEHPYAGIQIPGGTIEADEPHEAAAWREAMEETGLRAENGLRLQQYLGQGEEPPAPGDLLVAANTPIYIRPDPASLTWSSFRRGLTVTYRRQAPGFTQAEYLEWDDEVTRSYYTVRVLGWVSNAALTRTRIRHFYRFSFEGQAPDAWDLLGDEQHTMRLFWAPINDLPAIIPPQDQYLKWLK